METKKDPGSLSNPKGDFCIEQLFTTWEANKELPDPDLLMFYFDLDARELYLEDEINWATCNFIIKFINHINRRALVSGDMTPITLKIFSPGGELQVMFALYHIIKDSAVPIHTINMGACHSAAFTVFLAGHIRTMLPDAVFVAHQGSGAIGGSFKETKAGIAQYEKEVARMTDIICQRTNFTTEELNEQFDRSEDYYITYDIALEKGVITEGNIDLD